MCMHRMQSDLSKFDGQMIWKYEEGHLSIVGGNTIDDNNGARYFIAHVMYQEGAIPNALPEIFIHHNNPICYI
jgi:hypothetical protein